jgi:hypothetical protein
MRTVYEEECTLYNTDHDKTVTAEVIGYRPGEHLRVLLESRVQMTLQFNNKHNIYVGNMAGLEFTSKGPKSYGIKSGRIR